jgi:4-amino-4-deoxy-L-arabinose transferase-like glycosyltransferase
MKKACLAIIIFLALFLRLYRLADFPTGLNADEAAIGYNAYSLLETGKDEFGHPWPINFQSFNDWKPGLYFYLVLPFVKILGLSEWAVRLPSAILGTLTVLLVYFLVKELSGEEESQGWGLAAAFILAVSPWHLHFSRGGWETNAATFFMTAGVLFLFKALKKPKFYFLAVFLLLAAMFTYHSARVVVPLFGLGWLFLNWQKIWKRKNWPWLSGAAAIGIFFFGLLLWSMVGQAGSSRFAGVGLLADPGPLWRANELRGQHGSLTAVFPKLLHNQYLEYGIQFLDNYFKHFSGDFLFVSGDEIQRNRVPGMGQLYLIEAPILALGFYFLLKRRPGNWPILLWWLAVAPIASALTFQSPHAIRALNLVVPLTLMVAYGGYRLCLELKKSATNKRLIVAVTLMVVVYLGSVSYYLRQYYVSYPEIYPAAWEDGFRQLGKYLSENQKDFERIYITNQYDQSYILLAFYLKYPPAEFQKEAKLSPRDRFGFSTVESFGQYYFGPIDWQSLKGGKRVMIVGTSEEIPDSARIVKRIYFKDGKKEAFRIAEN